MTLENIVKGLGVIGENGKVNPKYNSKVLTSVDEYLDDLGEVDIETQEGLKKYRDITGFPTKGVHPKMTALGHKGAYAQVAEGLREYAIEHLEPIAKELGETKMSNIVYSFCPTAESKHKGSDDYNIVMDKINTAKKTVEKIQENPMAYVSEQIKKAPEWMRGVIAMFPKEVCDIDIRYAQGKTLGAISKYGSAKFITETHKSLETLQSAYRVDMEALSKEEKELEKKIIPDSLDTDESVEYFAGIKMKKVELTKRAEQIKMLSGIADTVVKEAVGAIREREKK